MDDYTHYGYNDVAGIITSDPVCSYDNFDGLLITEFSIGDCLSSVETTSGCTPCIIQCLPPSSTVSSRMGFFRYDKYLLNSISSGPQCKNSIYTVCFEMDR